jgi:O-antigen/teichoic acid export membrane protein
MTDDQPTMGSTVGNKVSRRTSIVKRHSPRFLALGVTYVAERIVLLAVIMIPVLAGVSAERIGELEIALAAGVLGATVGPLGTTTALMHERFRDRMANITIAVLFGTIGGALIGAVLSVQLGLAGMLAGCILGAGLAWNRIAQNRMRVERPIDNLAVTAPLLGLFALVMGLAWIVDADLAAVAPFAVVAGGAGALVALRYLLSGRMESGEAQTVEMMRFGVPLTISAVAIWVVASADRYLVGWLMDLEAVGVYAPLYRVSMLFSGAAATVVVWWGSESLRRGASWAADRTQRFLVIVVPAATVAAMVAWWPLWYFLVGVVDRPEDEVGAVVAWLLCSVVAWVAANVILAPLVAASDVKTSAVVWVVAAVVNIGLNLALIPKYGLPGAAAATAFAQATAAVLAWRALRNVEESILVDGENPKDID